MVQPKVKFGAPTLTNERGQIKHVRGRVWRRQHAAGERHFAKALRAYFQEQAERLASEVQDFAQPTPAIVPLLFRPHDEHERLQRVARPQLLRLMIQGTTAELEPFADDRKALDPLDDLSGYGLDIPARTLAAIRRQLDELELQDYWLAIQSETDRRLATIIEHGIEDGLSNYEMSMLIREDLGGFPARRRALMIARTETTGALNAGHEAAREDLYEAGLIDGREWLTIGDRHVRASHQLLQGAVAMPRENFSVGGYPARWPGDWSLPAEQRIRCRCTTVSVFPAE